MRFMNRRHLAAAAAAFALLVVMVALSRDFGFTWDERFQQKYGEELWDYYHGRLPRTSFDTDFGMQYLYAGGFEFATVVAQHLVRADTYVVRHAVNAVTGWVGIVCCGLLAGALWGSRAGWLAAILLTLSPRYFADAMNNPKDAPFAAFAMLSIAIALTMPRRPPYLTWTRTAALALAIILAINVRPLGLMLIGYTAFVLTLYAVAEIVQKFWGPGGGPRSAPTLLSETVATWGLVAVKLALIAIVAIPAGTISWPWAQSQPYVRAISGLATTMRLDWMQGFPVLYGGHDISADTLPWHYVPTWLALSLPPVVLAGLVLSPIAWRRWPASRLPMFALTAFALVPIATAIIRHATIYDGARHVLFIVPPLVALSAAGWSAALDVARSRVRTAVAVLLVIGLAEPLVFQIRNHPNQIVYFSPVSGGPRAAFARYEMDYWGNCVLQAVQWSARLSDLTHMSIGVSGNPLPIVESDAMRYHSLWTRNLRAPDYHLDIRLMRGPSGSLREFAARPDILYSVSTSDGVPLCLVFPGPLYPTLNEALNKIGCPAGRC